jgi:hypothetical protein
MVEVKYMKLIINSIVLSVAAWAVYAEYLCWGLLPTGCLARVSDGEKIWRTGYTINIIVIFVLAVAPYRMSCPCF